MFFDSRFNHPGRVLGALLGASLGALLSTGAHGKGACPEVDCQGLKAAQCVEKHKEENRKQLAYSANVDRLPGSLQGLSGGSMARIQELSKEVKSGQAKVAELEGSAASLAASKPADALTEAAQSTAQACQTAEKFREIVAILTADQEAMAEEKGVEPEGDDDQDKKLAGGPAGPVNPPFDRQGFCVEHCLSPASFCIDIDTGRPYCEGVQVAGKTFEEPERLREGQTWTVRVVGVGGGGEEIELTIGEIKTSDQLLRDGDGIPKMQIAPPPPPPPRVLKEVAYTVPSKVDLTSVQVLFSRKGAGAVSSRYEVPVDRGRYYVDLGVLIPMVPSGERAIVQTLVPGTGGERRLTVREDWQVEVALALNVFPCGRRRALWSAFQQMDARGTLCDLVGVQVGLDLDFKNAFQRIYAGVLLEPVAGLGVSAGVALVQGEFFPPGYAEGMIVPRGETFTPETKYMARPYVGITLSTDILTSITQAGSSIKSKF